MRFWSMRALLSPHRFQTRVRRGLAAVLFTPTCPLCNRPGRGLLPVPCGRCSRKDVLSGLIEPMSGGRCSRCAALLPTAQSCGEEGTFCAGRSVFFDRHRALWPLSAERRELLHRWKFENERELWRFIWERARAVPALLAGLRAARFDCVAWIDSGRGGRRVRNYQPCADLARAMGAALNCPAGALLRKRHRRTQSALSLPERFFAMHGSLECPPGRDVPARVLLMEDVYTTGATANEAARCLKKNGAFHVEVISLFIRDAGGVPGADTTQHA